MVYPNYYYRYNNYYNRRMANYNLPKETEPADIPPTEEPILEILGIKLYFDDILIIGLLFFLYNEGVKDEFLFISLILLLLG